MKITHDTLSTVLGMILAAMVGGASAYLAGQVTKESVLAAAIVAGGGWYLKRGDTRIVGGKE